ncbi:uncharacterized protein LOC122386563 [Amphibalanus amphitrite]|uniref:uncharacterized protein LOC122386563 n=1 Tax=Amphibalanus amphitrite TaxID=1232801 RepID=UPI001C911B37|nr:uncharacterized protein LOC122386563 [Amphibalanus amphitrite]
MCVFSPVHWIPNRPLTSISIAVTVKNTNQTRSRTIRGGFFVQTQSADQARTNGSNFSSVVDGRNFSVTDVQDVTVITQNSSNLTRDGSVQGGQIGTADLTSQKLVQKERSEQDLKTSEQHNIKAGRNEISVNSVKDSNLTMDEELRDQLTVDGYKKQYGNVQTPAVLFISVTRIPGCFY